MRLRPTKISLLCTWGLYLLLWMLISACPQREGASSQTKARLVRELSELEKEEASLDEKIKNGDSDRGAQIQWAEQKELLKSRMERVKAKLRSGPGSR